jgi:predicted permease
VMRALSRLLRVARGLLRRRDVEREIDEELRTYLFMEKGRLDALTVKELSRAKESIRDSKSEYMFDTLAQDLRQAIRVLQQNKTWTLVAVLTLALGIAPLTAFYSLIERVYAPMPVHNPDELVFSRTHNLPVNWYSLLRENASTMTDVIAFARDNRRDNRVEVLADSKLGTAYVEYISGNYYPVLGVSPARGRTILPEDDQPAARPVAMISEVYWESGFGKRGDVIGETIQVENRSFTIVGVWPAEFVDATGDISRYNNAPMRPEIMIPLAHHPQVRNLRIVGRTRPGATLAQINAEAGSLLFADTPRPSGQGVFEARHHGIRGMFDMFQRSPLGSTLTMMLLVAFFGAPLFLSCTNIATFLLSRTEDRRVEIAMRLSLGASRARLIRQLLAESVVLAALGGMIAILFTYWWTRILANPPFTAYGNLPINWTAFLFVALLILPVGVGCGLLPAMDATKNVAQLMRTFGAHFSRSKSERTRNLITVQVALSFFGLFCAGLMVRGIQRMDTAETGYNLDHIATFEVDLNRGAARDDKARIKTGYEEIVNAVSKVPGVQSASFSDQPLRSEASAEAQLYTLDSNRHLQQVTANWLGVDQRFFKTMDLRFTLGQPFNAIDRSSAQSVVITETLAHALFPNRNPIGLRFGRGSGNIEAFEVVGIVANEKTAAVYSRDVCCAGPKTFEVRVAGSPVTMLPLIKTALHNFDPDLPVNRLSAAKADIDASYIASEAPWRSLLAYYAGLATILVVTGVFGLMSHSVARRTREIGIRLAIGAQPRQVLSGVIREAVVMVIPGLIVGLTATLTVGRVMTNYLDGYASSDPFVIVGSIIVLVVIVSISGFFPALRASHIDPLRALRYD